MMHRITPIRRSLLLSLLLSLAGLAAAQQANPYGARSYEGMWLPLNLQELNYADMKSLGLELPANQVYNEQAPSLEDAIVKLNGGSCTAEMISGEGLVLTNHHCAFDAIAELSSVNEDLLTNGFWAMSRSDELPIPGATAAYLMRSENVTLTVLAKGEDPETVAARIDSIEQAASQEGKYETEVKEMFSGLEYYLFVYEVYTDVRLVGAPPSSIGKFGYDKDNWVWPRHTGDFSLLRVYAGKDNKPAEYAADNVPFKPRHFLPVSLKGVQEQDYAMIMGYPGSTERYLTSPAIQLALEQSNRAKIDLLGAKTQVMKSFMDRSDSVRIALASEYASLMNAYKYFIGQTEMLDRYDIVGLRKQEEAKFQAWADADAVRKEKYGTLMQDFEELYAAYKPADKAMNYVNFGAFSTQALTYTYSALAPLRGAINSGNPQAAQGAAAQTREGLDGHFGKFFRQVDQEVFTQTFLRFYQDLPADWRPAIFDELLNEPVGTQAPAPAEEPKAKKKKKKKGSESASIVVAEAPAPADIESKIRRWTERAYATALATNRSRMEAFLNNPQKGVIEQDPIFRFLRGVINYYIERVQISDNAFESQRAVLNKAYQSALREYEPQRRFYPDANSTMRLTYGKVLPYYPRDGVFYNYYTTLDGIMEKEDPTDPDYIVPAKLKELYKQKDFGKYGQNGSMRVCFLTTNDITGGNSGSPVLNSRGELIGCAFDGNWEAMAGDIYVFPQFNRTIAVDIRYVLFVIDKFAGAGHLLKEMKIVE
ncbi:MAG: S46 family peptidase [Bacteroidia bacterium]|nr:S46 family peptidase [Bacteroidia bacterium]